MEKILFGIPILLIAITLDILGLGLFLLSALGIGIPFSWILDIIGVLIIGFFLYFSSSNIVGLEKGFSNVFKKILPKLGLSVSLEAIPFLGDIFPSWTILVFWELIYE